MAHVVHRSSALPPVVRNGLGAAAIAVFVQGPTSAEFFKYVPNHNPPLLSIAAIVVTFVGALVLFTTLERYDPWRRFAASRAVTAILLVGITVISPPLYHLWAEHLPAGTSVSDVVRAMSDPVHALVHGQQMYDIHLPDKIPASPGPGWILLNAPFTLLHCSWLLIPFWLVVTSVVTRVAYGRGLEVNLALVLLCVSPHFARMIAEGQDLLVVPCAFILLMVVTDRWMRTMPWAIGIGFFAGIIATSRFIYLAFPLALSLLAWRRSRPQAVAVGLIGIGVAVAANVIASIGIHPYPPAHLFGRADSREPAWNVAIGAVVTSLVVLGMLWRFLRHDDNSWVLWLAGAWALAHGFIGLGELAGLHWVYRYWEGANYLFVGSVPLIAGVLLWRFRALTGPDTAPSEAIPAAAPAGA